MARAMFNPFQTGYAGARKATVNIVPNVALWHVGPRLMNDAGIIPHPLQLLGQFPSAPADSTGPYLRFNTPTYPAGYGGGSFLPRTNVVLGWPHPYTINGRQPG